MRLLSKVNVKLVAMYMGVLLTSLLCSPVGFSAIIALQAAPLPPMFYGVMRVLLSFMLFAPLLWLLIAAFAPAMAVFTTIKKQHRIAPLWLLIWLIAWSALPLTQKYDRFWGWRRANLQHVTVRAKPLIHAIDSHCTREGKCPQYLEDLVPKYIAKIPTTGAVGYPHFKYKPPGDRTYSSSYELLVETPRGGINWDTFVYWPDRKYPKGMYGGITECIGDWAYVHE